MEYNDATGFESLFDNIEDVDNQVEETVTTDELDQIIEEKNNEIEDLTGSIEEPSNTESTEEVDNTLSVMFNFLKEKRALYLPDDYEFDGSEEAFEKALNTSRELSEKTTFEGLLQALPEDYRDTIIFGLQTGRPLNEFLEYTKSFNLESLDLNQHSDQVRLLQRYYTQVAQFNPDRASKLIETLEKTGELQSAALEYYEEIKNLEHTRAQELILEEQNRREANARKAYENRTRLTNAIDSTPIINDSRRNTVKAFLFNEVARGNEIDTMYNRTLKSIQNNPEHIAQLADILLDYDPNKGIVLDRFNNQVKSNTVKSIKQQLQEARSNVKPNISGNPSVPKGNNFDWDSYLNQLG